jgi:hypothetical protein
MTQKPTRVWNMAVRSIGSKEGNKGGCDKHSDKDSNKGWKHGRQHHRATRGGCMAVSIWDTDIKGWKYGCKHHMATRGNILAVSVCDTGSNGWKHGYKHHMATRGDIMAVSVCDTGSNGWKHGYKHHMATRGNIMAVSMGDTGSNGQIDGTALLGSHSFAAGASCMHVRKQQMTRLYLAGPDDDRLVGPTRCKALPILCVCNTVHSILHGNCQVQHISNEKEAELVSITPHCAGCTL